MTLPYVTVECRHGGIGRPFPLVRVQYSSLTRGGQVWHMAGVGPPSPATQGRVLWKPRNGTWARMRRDTTYVDVEWDLVPEGATNGEVAESDASHRRFVLRCPLPDCRTELSLSEDLRVRVFDALLEAGLRVVDLEQLERVVASVGK